MALGLGGRDVKSQAESRERRGSAISGAATRPGYVHWDSRRIEASYEKLPGFSDLDEHASAEEDAALSYVSDATREDEVAEKQLPFMIHWNTPSAASLAHEIRRARSAGEPTG